MKRLSFLHTFLFASSSAIILYVSMLNVTVFIPPGDILVPTLLAVFIAVLLSLIFYALTRDARTAGVIASLFVIALLYLWYLFLAIIGITLVGIFIARLVLKKRIGFNEVNLTLSIVSLMVSAYYLYQFGSFTIGQSGYVQENPAHPIMAGQEVTRMADQSPDIYYIILDGYGRADMLQSVHGYDNFPFINELQQRGFVVAHKSQSNYPRTMLSLASSMNMEYLDNLTTDLGDSNLWWPASDFIQHGQVRSFLEQQGYRTVFIASGFDLTDIRDGDVYMKPYPIMLRNFQSAFISWTNLRVLHELPWPEDYFLSSNSPRYIILYNFETLPEVASIPGPKYVFSHVMAPHPPYIFGSQGQPVDQDYPSPEFGSPGYSQFFSQYRQGYLDQLTYINEKTIEMIDGILANSETPPVIILQGDHGPDIFMNYDDPAIACLYERYSILNAYYLPGVDSDSVPPDISPVNSFRMIFNFYFGTNLQVLQNLQYYSTNADPYQFQDVTESAGKQCELPVEYLP